MRILKKFESFSNYQIVVFQNIEELANVIWKDGELVDPTVFDRIRYFSIDDFGYYQSKTNAYYVTAFDNEKIIGVAKVGHFSIQARNEKNYAISFFTIDKDYRKQGLARQMCDALFRTAKEKGYEISTSSYTFLGKKFLQHLFNEYAKKYNVTFYDKTEQDSLHDTENSYMPYKDTFAHRDELI